MINYVVYYIILYANRNVITLCINIVTLNITTLLLLNKTDRNCLTKSHVMRRGGSIQNCYDKKNVNPL